MNAARRATGRLFVVSSPSGGGKTTAVRALLRQIPRLVRSVSVTTRPRRPSERHGAHYRFLSIEQFRELQRRGELLEWAKVHRAYYGTPRRPIERALSRGRDVMLSIDVQGARKIRRRFGERAILIFLVPPSLEALEARLVRRRTDSPEAIRHRLEAAKRELACAQWYDYAVVNHRLHDAIDRLKAIVMAARLRVRHANHNRRSHGTRAH